MFSTEEHRMIIWKKSTTNDINKFPIHVRIIYTLYLFFLRRTATIPNAKRFNHVPSHLRESKQCTEPGDWYYGISWWTAFAVIQDENSNIYFMLTRQALYFVDVDFSHIHSYWNDKLHSHSFSIDLCSVHKNNIMLCCGSCMLLVRDFLTTAII